MVATDQVQLVIATVGKPAGDDVRRQPFAPATLYDHAKEHLDHHKRHAADHQWNKDRAKEINRAGVALFYRVEKIAVPDVDTVLENDIGAEECNQANRAGPGELWATAAPEATGTTPEARQQVFSTRPFGFFGRQLSFCNCVVRRLCGLGVHSFGQPLV